MLNAVLQHLYANLLAYALTGLAIVLTLAIALYFERKHAYQKDIIGILQKCRGRDQWNDRSELKLFQWMLETDEDQLHNCSFWKLRKIRHSVSDYLYIHLHGRDPVPPPGRFERFFLNLSEHLRHRRESRVRQPRFRRRQTRKPRATTRKVSKR